ncbi:MAG: hypothetical protein CL613_09560 [Aquimarina sp.]|nr:hypothetical protein [Aquimarina sp.]
MIIQPASDHLHFNPIDIDLWKVEEDLYVGRPGEETLRLPQIVVNVLHDIRSAKPSPYYQLRQDGKYYIHIPAYHIKGIAFWT